MFRLEKNSHRYASGGGRGKIIFLASCTNHDRNGTIETRDNTSKRPDRTWSEDFRKIKYIFIISVLNSLYVIFLSFSTLFV